MVARTKSLRKRSVKSVLSGRRKVTRPKRIALTRSASRRVSRPTTRRVTKRSASAIAKRSASALSAKRRVSALSAKRSASAIAKRRVSVSRRVSRSRTLVSRRVSRPRVSSNELHTKWQIEHQSVGIGPLKKGELGKHGYSSFLPEKKRDQALDKAVREYGSLSVFRKLNALSIYNKNRSPETSAIFKHDRDMIKNVYMTQ